jgi:hypothetical protein
VWINPAVLVSAARAGDCGRRSGGARGTRKPGLMEYVFPPTVTEGFARREAIEILLGLAQLGVDEAEAKAFQLFENGSERL